MRTLLVVASVFLLFTTIAQAGTIVNPALTCATAGPISSLADTMYQVIQSESIMPSLTFNSLCTASESVVSQAWFLYTPPNPVYFTIDAHYRNPTGEIRAFIEATGYSNCLRDQGSCYALDVNESEVFTPYPYPALIPRIPYYLRFDFTVARGYFDIFVAYNYRPDLIPGNDECQGALSNSQFHIGTLPFTTSGDSTFATSVNQEPIGDVYYFFSGLTGKNTFVACAEWPINVYLDTADDCEVGTAAAKAERAAGLETASAGPDKCARLTASLSKGFVVVAGDTPLDRGKFTLSIQPLSHLVHEAPEIIL